MLTRTLLNVFGPEGTPNVGPDRLRRYASSELRTYHDYQQKVLFDQHFVHQGEVFWAQPAERVCVLQNIREHYQGCQQLVVLSSGNEGLELLVDALDAEKMLLISLSGYAERQGTARAKGHGMPVIQVGARDGGYPENHISFSPTTTDELTTILAQAEALAAQHLILLSIHLSVLDPFFAPASGLGMGGGWSTRRLVQVLRSLLRLPCRVVELGGYAPYEDQRDLTLYAAAAVLQTLIEVPG